jgi:hypothetical protein
MAQEGLCIDAVQVQALSCFSDVGIQDRVVIQELIKNVAQTNQLDTGTQKDFKGKANKKSVLSFFIQ